MQAQHQHHAAAMPHATRRACACRHACMNERLHPLQLAPHALLPSPSHTHAPWLPAAAAPAPGSNLTTNLRDFFSRGKTTKAARRAEEQDLVGFGRGGEAPAGWRQGRAARRGGASSSQAAQQAALLVRSCSGACRAACAYLHSPHLLPACTAPTRTQMAAWPPSGRSPSATRPATCYCRCTTASPAPAWTPTQHTMTHTTQTLTARAAAREQSARPLVTGFAAEAAAAA